MSKNERIEWIDIAKGIAISIVIIAHIRGFYYDDWIQNVLSTLHNPTFFLASGYLLARSIDNEKSSIHLMVEKGLKLLLPFLTWICTFSIVVSIIFRKEILYIVLDCINRLWFLPVLFVGLCFTVIVIRSGISPVVIFVVGIALAFISSNRSSFLTKTIMYSLMVLLGAFIDKYKRVIYSNFLRGGVITFWLLSNMLFTLGAITTRDIVSASGKALMINLIGSICGGLIILELSKIMSEKMRYSFNILKFEGKNSLYLYILHNAGLYYLVYMSKNLVNSIVGISITVIFPLVWIYCGKRRNIFGR